MSLDQCMGTLLPEDGPTDYEWYALGPAGASADGDLPGIEVGKIPSDGHHEPTALTAPGAVVLTANQVSRWAGLKRLRWSGCRSDT